MTVAYEIYPEQNLVLYICSGSVMPLAFFEAGDLVALDARFRSKMDVIIDFLHAELEVAVSDLHLAIRKNSELQTRGLALGRTAVLTRSMGLNYLGEALVALSMESISTFRVFNNEADVLAWLELPGDFLPQWLAKR